MRFLTLTYFGLKDLRQLGIYYTTKIDNYDANFVRFCSLRWHY